jgi:hypothetical protein
MGGTPGLGVGRGLITSRRKKELACYEILHRASKLAGSCENGDEPCLDG